MTIPTKNKILKSLISGDPIQCIDKWYAPKIYTNTRVTEIKYDFNHHIETKHKLVIETRSRLKANEKGSFDEREKAAEFIFNKLYGDIVYELYQILYGIKYSDRDETTKEIVDLIEKLEENPCRF